MTGPTPTTGDDLTDVWAKSIDRATGRAELLTEHSAATRSAARDVAARIGSPGILAEDPRFWELVEIAAFLHDAGKVAEGFQWQVRPGGPPSWGERHEVLSLAYVDLLTMGMAKEDQLAIAAGVVFHHRSLSSDRGTASLETLYPPFAAWDRKFGIDPDPRPGQPSRQVPGARHRNLLTWLAGHLGRPVPPSRDRKLWERARDLFAEVTAAWRMVDPDHGLRAVLFQGAVTLADHSASAHVLLQRHSPLPPDFLDRRLDTPYPHQRLAGQTDGHLVLVSPTGSGKTEAGLAWAARQMTTMPGRPRLVWVLPYRASINAAAQRFGDDLVPASGEERPDIGVLHGTTAQALLTEAVEEDCAATAEQARKASARAEAMRLFVQRVRVATAYQLLIGAIAGPRYSSVLLEQANATVVLDELHAYDPATFGRICAAMRLWEQLGSRVAVVTATLAPPMVELIGETLTEPVTVHRAPPGTAPDRHRLVLDDEPITAPASLERIRRWLAEGHSVLAVANTVATAQELYAALAPAARAATPDDPAAALLLHSRFRHQDRAQIERKLLARHPERRPGEPARRGGLVVATQTVEVSLCLDFDRGVTELAPIESVAQRAGRVNRRGRHPDGPVEYRVHEVESPPHPYDAEAVDAARSALRASPGPVISEQTIDAWLAHAYATDWGRSWAEEARRHRDQFATSFLTFTEPFHDRAEFADKLRESFDTVEVLLGRDEAVYTALTEPPDGHALRGAGHLIPISYRQWRKTSSGRTTGRRFKIPLVDAPYSPETGLDLGGSPPAPPPPPEPPRETIL